ncbi:hypothetical protein Q1695_002951 [Nippostrongylus brasiliensis]|nr:hypothetical protein Q1695_002951 [Nippostrongylus brasiliensis]
MSIVCVIIDHFGAIRNLAKMELVLLLVLFSSNTCICLEIGYSKADISKRGKIINSKFTDLAALFRPKTSKSTKVPSKIANGHHKFTNVRHPISRCVGSPTLPGLQLRDLAALQNAGFGAIPPSKIISAILSLRPVKKYTFDPKKGCVEFTFGGCKPAPNNFETLAECRKACIAR